MRRSRPHAPAKTGTISGVRTCGSVVLVLLDLSDGITIWVPFEHGAFHDLLDAEDCSAEDLIGRRATAPDGMSLVIHGT